jgi:alpha-L-rhamnosidase
LSFEATRLRCEHRQDIPLIDEEAPRLGWILAADGRERSQSAYRVLVATSSERLAAAEGNLWDSGKIASAQTFDVRYGGAPLPPASELLWTVQVFDETGEASDWAEPASFRTALPSWSAEWIGFDPGQRQRWSMPDSAGGDDTGATLAPGELLAAEGAPGLDMEALSSEMLSPAYLRRTFSLAEPVRRATLYATARGVVDLELNGERVGEDTLTPGWTDYHQRLHYTAHDVTALVREDENVLGAILGDGWWASYLAFRKKRAGALYGDHTELLCELHLELAGGDTEVIASDGSWRSSCEGPIRHADFMWGEWHDARIDFDGWSRPDFVEGEDWIAVAVRPRDETLVVPEPCQPVRVTAEQPTVAISDRGEGVHVFDLGQNIVGRVRLRTAGPAGTRIVLRHGEALEEDGSLYTAGLLSARQTDTFVLRGEGTEVFEPRFTSHGFRYVEVSGLATPPDEGTITGCVAHTDAPLTSTFNCSNPMIERLHSAIVWTERGNFISVPTDCPQRNERLGWAGDGNNIMPTATLDMDVAALMTKWLQDFRDAQSPAGAFADVAPRIAWTSDGAPGWGEAGVMIPWVLLRRYGDKQLVARHWRAMERWMDYVAADNPDFLRKRGRNADFGDWLNFGEVTPKEMLGTAYWARAASLMAVMARALQREGRAAHYEHLSGEIRRAFNRTYVGEDAEIDGDTQAGYVLALAFDLLPEELRPRAAERLVASLEGNGWRLRTGIIGSSYICPVLAATGHADVAHRLLASEELPSWGHMIRHGATTIWENWDGYTEEHGFFSELQNSFNHYSFGAIGAWLIEGVAGIRLDEERLAYERVVIEPVPGELESAGASYHSIRGEISSQWSQGEGRFRLAVTVPANVAATVVVPARGESLSEGGAPAAAAPGVRSVDRDGDSWRVEVGSGCYEFESA